MDCVINSLIRKYDGKEKQADVLARYIRMKYKIIIDPETLRKREKAVKLQYH